MATVTNLPSLLVQIGNILGATIDVWHHNHKASTEIAARVEIKATYEKPYDFVHSREPESTVKPLARRLVSAMKLHLQYLQGSAAHSVGDIIEIGEPPVVDLYEILEILPCRKYARVRRVKGVGDHIVYIGRWFIPYEGERHE